MSDQATPSCMALLESDIRRAPMMLHRPTVEHRMLGSWLVDLSCPNSLSCPDSSPILGAGGQDTSVGGRSSRGI